MEHVGEFVVNHWVLVLLFVGLAGSLLFGLYQNKLSGATAIDVTQATQIVNRQKGLFVDIREATEFGKGYIADSKNMPLSSLSEQLDAVKDRKQPIILVCATGQRASAAGKLIREQGFSEVYLLRGGINAWKDAKLPLFTKKDGKN